MTRVFVSGSRNIRRLNNTIYERLNNIIKQQLTVVVGDANGADTAIQQYLKEGEYNNVVVYCAGDKCRNNLGNWRIEHIQVDPKIKGREFYTQKDIAMATNADYGLVLWDGKSSGSMNNVFHLLKQNKKTLVYYAPEQSFYPIKHLDDAQKLLDKCDKSTLDGIARKIKLASSLKEIKNEAQGALAF